MRRGYVIINTIDITQDMIDESIHHDSTFRVSLDGSEAILKFESEYPNTMAGRTKLTLDEIKAYLVTNTADWEE